MIGPGEKLNGENTVNGSRDEIDRGVVGRLSHFPRGCKFRDDTVRWFLNP